MAGRTGSITGVVFGALLLLACSSEPTPSPTPTPLELGDGPPTASAAKDGISLDLWLDHTDITVGDNVLALVRLTNSREEAVFRETNLCDTAPAATTIGQNETTDAVPFGIDWPARAGIFKRQLLTDAGLGKRRELGRFADTSLVGGVRDCGHVGPPTGPLAPGSSDDIHLTWLAVPREGSVLVPGRANIHSTFSTFHIVPEDSSPIIKVEVDVPITIAAAPGSDANSIGLTLVDYVDAALSVPQFRDWMDNAASGVYFKPDYTFTATTVEIRATILEYTGAETPESHSVTINRATGVVMSFK